MLFGLLSYADDITQQQALKIAQTFLSSQGSPAKAAMKGLAENLKCTHTVSAEDGQDCLYVFNAGQNGGFVIVAADDRANEVLGYSDSGYFDYGLLSSDAKNWMTGYVDEITYIRANNVTRRQSEPRSLAKSVKPLLGDIQWDQTFPYNKMCPYYDINNRCATGCVATAMAQVMYYNRWPEVGVGSHSYAPSILGGRTLTADFGATQYNWDAMSPTYDDNSSEASRDAVALLMLHCGIAVDMVYYSTSGATSIDIPKALTAYFDYDKGVAYRQRSNYNSSDWEDIIINEIDNNRPVIATGKSSSGGHCFVFDGYDEDGFIHVNWGWSGMGNGYFRTSALNPAVQGTGGYAGGYNYTQQIITGIQRPSGATHEDVEIVSTEGLVPSSDKISNGDNVDVALHGFIYNAGWQKSVFEYGLELVDSAGETVKDMATDKTYELGIGYEMEAPTTNDVNFGKLSDGAYTLYPVCRSYGSDGEWMRVRDEYVGYPNYINVNVSGDEVVFVHPDYFDLSVKDISLPSAMYSGIPTNALVHIANEGDVDYLGEIKAILLDKDTRREVAAGTKYKLDLAAGASLDMNIGATFSPSPGDYLLTVVDDDNHRIMACQDITINAAPDEDAVITMAEQLSFADNANVDKQSLDITAKLKCEQGVYGGDAYLYIFNESGAVIRGCLDPQYVFATAGETIDVHISGTFENGVPSTIYLAALVLYDGTQIKYVTPLELSTCYFRIAATTGIGMADADNGTDSKQIYDIRGQRQPVSDINSLPKGVYIVRHGTATMKIVRR